MAHGGKRGAARVDCLVPTAGYHGTFWELFNPCGLLTAVLFVLLFLQHGAL